MRKKTPVKKIIGITFLVLIVLLIGGRLYLPYWVTDYVNRRIDRLEGYGGSVRDIDIHLWRGAYQIHRLNIYKKKSGIKEPFVSAKTVDLSVEWRALLHGAVVAQVDIDGIDLNFAKNQTGKGAGWADFINDLSPFKINYVHIHSGKVAYKDPAASPKVDLYIAGIDARVTNLRNVEDKKMALPSDLRVSGTSIGKGNFHVAGKMNILHEIPDFTIDVKLENANLTAFNDYTRAAAAVDFVSGKISVYSEIAAANGTVTGYVKPLLTDVEVIDVVRQDQNIFNVMWEAIVTTFMTVFKNHPRDQFAMRIPIAGDLKEPKRDMWSAFVSIFQNAFGKAFPKNTDGNIDFRDALEKSRQK